MDDADDSLAISPYFHPNLQHSNIPELSLSDENQLVALTTSHCVVHRNNSIEVQPRTQEDSEYDYCPVCNSKLRQSPSGRRDVVQESDQTILVVTDPNYFKLISQFASSGQQIPPELMTENYFTRFFIIQKTLGRGAFGSVFLCHHVLDGANLGSFAVKMVPVGDRRELLRKSVREAAILAMVKHANVVDYKHSWQEKYTQAINGEPVPCFFLLMEYAELGSVCDLVEMYGSKNASLSQITVLSLLYQACTGLEYIHSKGIIHRDIKPENLMLQRSIGNPTTVQGRYCPFRLIIGDFGSAIVIEDTTSAQTVKACTPRYCAPELRKGSVGCYRSDIWSLGMVLFFLTFNQHPFIEIPEDQLSEMKTWPKEDLIPTFPWNPSHPIQHLWNICLQLDYNDRPSASTLLTYISVSLTSTPANLVPALEYVSSRRPGAGASARSFYEEHFSYANIEKSPQSFLLPKHLGKHLHLILLFVHIVCIYFSPSSSARSPFETFKCSLFHYQSTHHEFGPQTLVAVFFLSLALWCQSSITCFYSSTNEFIFTLMEVPLFLIQARWIYSKGMKKEEND